MTKNKKVLIIDNYDSFVYNLIDEFKLASCSVITFRNDMHYEALTKAIRDEAPDLIVLSPGPGHPNEAGHCIRLLRDFSEKIPFLGICLGHQAMACAFGGSVRGAEEILHGKASAITHSGEGIFANLDNPMRVGRYHSLIVKDLPRDMEVIASHGDMIMAMRHKRRHVYGIQFHPESFLTPQGPQLIRDFLKSLESPVKEVSFSEVLNQMLNKKKVELLDFSDVFKQLVSGELNEAQGAAFLTALRSKGETAEEIAAAAAELKEKALGFDLPLEYLVDNCGTGGDGSNTFNISTTAAFIAAGAGAHVAKHGNRSVSSKSGSADVLETLGVSIEMSVEEVKEAVSDCGLGFLFARLYHPAMKHVAPIRAALGMRTIFNILGPLLNPARVKRQVIGVFDPAMVPVIAEALLALGHEQALVVHGSGLDEFAIHGDNTVAEVKDGRVTSSVIHPKDLGFTAAGIDTLKGGGPEDNAKITESILKGEELGPKRDVSVMNAAATIYVSGLASSFEEGIEKAKASIDDGSAFGVLEKLRAKSKKLKKESSDA
jgi:anthranilate synthase/phosphoribosyltransferase